MAIQSLSPRVFQQVEVPIGVHLPRSIDVAISEGWEIFGSNSQFTEAFTDAGEIFLHKELGDTELRCTVPYVVEFKFETPRNLQAFVIVPSEPTAVENGGVSIYRVTAWDPETTRTFNVGLFTAYTREHAIRKAQVPAYREMVLDAVEVEVKA